RWWRDLHEAEQYRASSRREGRNTSPHSMHGRGAGGLFDFGSAPDSRNRLCRSRLFLRMHSRHMRFVGLDGGTYVFSRVISCPFTPWVFGTFGLRSPRVIAPAELSAAVPHRMFSTL